MWMLLISLLNKKGPARTLFATKLWGSISDMNSLDERSYSGPGLLIATDALRLWLYMLVEIQTRRMMLPLFVTEPCLIKLLVDNVVPNTRISLVPVARVFSRLIIVLKLILIRPLVPLLRDSA
jgi:hypothetical protein